MNEKQLDLFPETAAPDFSDVKPALQKAEGPQTLQRELAGIMTSIDIRVLVNGRSEEVRKNALVALVDKGVSTEFIEMTLKDLSRRAPKMFPPEEVAETLKWVETEWYTLRNNSR